MRKRLMSFWENYKFRFVPWIVLNLKKRKLPESHESEVNLSSTVKKTKLNKVNNDNNVPNTPSLSSSSSQSLNSTGGPIVHHVTKGRDKLIPDEVILHYLIKLFDNFEQNATQHEKNASEASKRNLEIMHNTLGYSIERRKSLVSDDAGTGVFLASGSAKPGSLIALYPGTIYMPSEPLFFPSIGNPFIFRCSDGVHIDGNDKWISKSIFKSCAARDKFRYDLPCCDESWLTSNPLNPLNIGQYVNNRSKSAVNNVVYQESSLRIALSISNSQRHELPVQFCKYLPNVWSNPGNNHQPLRLVPLVASTNIEEGDEILSSYFTVVHSDDVKKHNRS
ncbi:SET domain-containing protein 9 [Orchesella cincta]|uniref:SET domain-containing protein 9 n=1 Tax=Orchesella cincta TaxID=48709 RepID=A0A1D2M9G5_ORCCI|nr:SET domain-containing protein 9 [Orchesella cincta]